jgi:class 3 adenylate cyclase
MALLREADHAVRAVAAGLDLFAALEPFNEPRRLLGLPVFTARGGIASGRGVPGHVGTYDKMDYTAIGTTANLGAPLESIAERGHPCISRQTRSSATAFATGNATPRCGLEGTRQAGAVGRGGVGRITISLFNLTRSQRRRRGNRKENTARDVPTPHAPEQSACRNYGVFP